MPKETTAATQAAPEALPDAGQAAESTEAPALAEASPDPYAGLSHGDKIALIEHANYAEANKAADPAEQDGE